MDLLDLFLSDFYLSPHGEGVLSAGHMCSINIHIYNFPFFFAQTEWNVLPFVCLIHDLLMCIIAKTLFRYSSGYLATLASS